MDDQLDVETFNHLVELAALELNPEEAEYIRRQLNNQLTAIHELEAIPLDDVIKPTSHGVTFVPENSQPPREDVLHSYEDPAGILAQAPLVEDGYVIVPEIPHTTLK
jgi:aspartyl/glutamyl-tRNA(Asn/Gln) amidotransferase C subunit